MFRLSEQAHQGTVGVLRKRLVSKTLESAEKTIYRPIKSVEHIAHAAARRQSVADN
jgi:hypothetical protein